MYLERRTNKGRQRSHFLDTLHDSHDWSNDPQDSDFASREIMLEVVKGYNTVEKAFDEIEGIDFDRLDHFLHISWIFAWVDLDCHAYYVVQHSHQILQKIELHTSWVVKCQRLLWNNPKFSKADPVIWQEEQKCKQILQDTGDHLQQHREIVHRVLQFGYFFSYFGCIFESAEESEQFPCHPHLLVYFERRSLLFVINRVQGRVLEESKELNMLWNTLSLPSVLEMSWRNVFRASIFSSICEL